MKKGARSVSFPMIVIVVAIMISAPLVVPLSVFAADKEGSAEKATTPNSQGQSKSNDHPLVSIKTSAGEITIELSRKHAPVSVENFIKYAESGAYNGTIFHRVIPGFMIQGGGFDKGMNKRPTQSPISNEAANGLRNDTGTIAMARTSVVDSATNQFFINCKNNEFLNHRSKDPRGYGYAVFGKVVKGLDVVRTIEKTPTGTRDAYRDVPLEDVIIESVVIKRR